jgi:hypothetical protein
MQRLVGELAPAIGAAFESEDYRNRIEALQDEAKQREERPCAARPRSGAEVGVALAAHAARLRLRADEDGEETLSPEEFEQLPEARQQESASTWRRCTSACTS